MKKSDFWRTPDFSYKEVEATGSNVEGVELLAMLTVQKVRTDLDVVIHLCKNGLNSGYHLSKTHPNGDAVDFYFDHYIDPIVVVIAMIKAGFTGIGVYRNVGGFYSYHGDIGEVFRKWFREYKDDGTHKDMDLFNSKLRK